MYYKAIKRIPLLKETKSTNVFKLKFYIHLIVKDMNEILKKAYPLFVIIYQKTKSRNFNKVQFGNKSFTYNFYKEMQLSSSCK